MDNASVILVLSCLGIAQALFLCVYLITLRKGNRQAHVFLALVILGLTIRIGKSILNEYLQLDPWQRNVGIAGILLVGPSLWIYGRLLLRKEVIPLKKSYANYIPFVLFIVFSVYIPNRFDSLSLAIYYGVFGHLLFYLVLSSILYFRSKTTSQKRLFKWYRNLVIGVGILWAFYIGNVSGFIPFYIGGALCYSFLIYLFAFLLLRKHTFSLEKYQGQPLDETTSTELIAKLYDWFEESAPYLESNFTLAKAAAFLETQPKVLSRVINETKAINFSEFVNSFRIEKAKKLLISAEHQNEKIASIAYDSGFNNVTSFNLAFKGMTKLTPSEYRKKASLKK